MTEDPTKIKLQTNIKKERDPTLLRMRGVTAHGFKEFDVPFISHIEGNLWQGGCDEEKLHLMLPQFFEHLISLYPWEKYKVTIKDQLKTEACFRMYDSLEQSMEQVDVIAKLINIAKKDGPTLVHCQAGLNRSSLVAARSLMLDKENPRTAQQAIDLLRGSRSPACLCNKTFESWLFFVEQLDIAQKAKE